MSKMAELAAAYHQARKDYFDYQGEAASAAGAFRRALISHLGADDDQVRFMSLADERDEKRTYSARGAMHEGEDGWLHVGFLLTIYDDRSSRPHDKTLFPVLVKKIQGHWVFLLEPGGRQFKITKHDDAGSYDELCDEIYASMMGSYVDAVKIFLHEKPKTVLGFVPYDLSE